MAMYENVAAHVKQLTTISIYTSWIHLILFTVHCHSFFDKNMLITQLFTVATL